LQQETQQPVLEVQEDRLVLDGTPIPGIKCEQTGDHYTFHVDGISFTADEEEVERWTPLLAHVRRQSAVTQAGGGSPPSGFEGQLGTGT
jgi:hypothetical protein